MSEVLSAVPPRGRAVMAAWLAVLAISGVLAARVGGVVRGGSDAVPGSASMVAVDHAVAAGVPPGTFYPFLAVLHADDRTVDDPVFAAKAAELSRALHEFGGAAEVRSVWTTGDRRLVGRDERSALLLVRTDAATFSAAELATAPLRSAVGRVRLPAGMHCEITGQPAVLYDLNRRSSADLLDAERIGLPLTLLILLIVFRSPLAALLPILLAMTATTLSMATLWALSHYTLVSVFAQNVVSMVGLGVGVDYALLLLTAFRAALATGCAPRAAARRAVREVRATIVCSGVAVAIGFLALLLVRLPFLKALVYGGVVAVAAAVLATLTLLPEVLAFLGARLSGPRRPGRTARPGAFWSRWAQAVMHHPAISAALALLVLGVFVAPVGRLAGWNLGASGIDADLEARRGYEILVREFAPGWIAPAVLVIESAPAGGPARGARAAIGALAARLVNDRRVALVASGGQGRVVLLALVGKDPPESRAAEELVRSLRADRYPELAGTGLEVRVTGATAMLADFDREIFGRLRLVVPVVLLVTFLVLLAHLRSILVPLKAIVLNLLSVLASYGFLILVFQDGHGAGLLGLNPPGGINAFIVLMLFTILFGLSMDYEVFLLSSIRAAWLRTGSATGAVAEGIARTGGLITSAAAIMVSLFLAFGCTRLVATREFGLGLAFAVALDATLVRLVLVPALMTLLGSANWWLPGVRRRPRTLEAV